MFLVWGYLKHVPVPYSCYNKWPQAEWLKPAQVYYFTAPMVRNSTRLLADAVQWYSVPAPNAQGLRFKIQVSTQTLVAKGRDISWLIFFSGSSKGRISLFYQILKADYSFLDLCRLSIFRANDCGWVHFHNATSQFRHLSPPLFLSSI